MSLFIDELKNPSTLGGVEKLLGQIKDINETIALNNDLIKRFADDPSAQQILRDDNTILFSFKQENLRALQHCSPELIKLTRTDKKH